jgi:hypothetical protein
MIKPTKYPVGPDDMADLFDQASNQGKNGKQDTLVSGTNIKTINGGSLLGSGDLTISSAASWGDITGTLSSQSDLNTALSGKQSTLVSGTSIKTVNGNSLLGSGDISIGPRLLGYSGTLGTSSSGNSVTVSKSLLIPANTLTTNCILEIQWRLFRAVGNTGQMYSRLYINTANNLAGANLISGIITINGGSTQYSILADKSISISTNSLRYMNTTGSEAVASPLGLVTINRAVDQYLLFTAQAGTTGETATIDLFRVLLYA